MGAPSGMYVENHSSTGWEPWVVGHICEPIVRRIPASITPNSISVVNHFVTWTVFVLAATAPHLEPGSALVTRILAGFGVFAALILDCLDGMHARRTGQGSPLGEVVDHWLDALNVPLMGAAMVMTLGLDPITGAIALVLSTTPYNAQLVLYHHTRRFVHPTTSGFDGQVMLSVAYVGFGILFYFIPQGQYWVKFGVTSFAWLVVALNIGLAAFYFRRLTGFLRPHLIAFALFLGWSGVYVADLIHEATFALGVVAISFRLSGSYVLYSVLGQPYNGVDWKIAGWAVAIAVASPWLDRYSVGGLNLRDLGPILFFLHMVGLNLLEFLREVPALRPETQKR